jgi:hypothetical protein
MVDGGPTTAHLSSLKETAAHNDALREARLLETVEF